MEQTTNKHTMQFGKLYSHNLVIQILLITLTALLSCDRCLTISHSQVSKRHTWNQSCTNGWKNNDYINIEVMALGMQSKEHGANIQMFTSMENYVSLFGEVRWKRQGITFQCQLISYVPHGFLNIG